MFGEIWKVVPSVSGIMVSSEGRVMVIPYQAKMPHGGYRSYGGEPHFGVWSKTDGRFITVYKGKTYKVHRLVCEAFNGSEPFSGAVCMHLDENSANNRPDNLQWGTQKENLNAPGYLKNLSERSMKIPADVRKQIRARHEAGEMQKDIAADLGINFQTVSVIVNRQLVCDQEASQ